MMKALKTLATTALAIGCLAGSAEAGHRGGHGTKMGGHAVAGHGHGGMKAAGTHHRGHGHGRVSYGVGLGYAAGASAGYVMAAPGVAGTSGRCGHAYVAHRPMPVVLPTMLSFGHAPTCVCD
jgi:hypothetical protein